MIDVYPEDELEMLMLADSRAKKEDDGFFFTFALATIRGEKVPLLVLRPKRKDKKGALTKRASKALRAGVKKDHGATLTRAVEGSAAFVEGKMRFEAEEEIPGFRKHMKALAAHYGLKQLLRSVLAVGGVVDGEEEVEETSDESEEELDTSLEALAKRLEKPQRAAEKIAQRLASLSEEELASRYDEVLVEERKGVDGVLTKLEASLELDLVAPRYAEDRIVGQLDNLIAKIGRPNVDMDLRLVELLSGALGDLWNQRDLLPPDRRWEVQELRAAASALRKHGTGGTWAKAHQAYEAARSEVDAVVGLARSIDDVLKGREEEGLQVIGQGRRVESFLAAGWSDVRIAKVAFDKDPDGGAAALGTRATAFADLLGSPRGLALADHPFTDDVGKVDFAALSKALDALTRALT